MTERLEEVAYSAAHLRLRCDRGSAAKHACSQCGGQAREWAYDHSDPDERVSPEGLVFSLDQNRYQPMCNSCHRMFDADHKGQARCGTDAGYYRHRRIASTPCQSCKTAHAVATHRRKWRARAEAVA